MLKNESPKLELDSIKTDLETVILEQISDETDLTTAIDILETITDENSLFTALGNLQTMLTSNCLQTIYEKIATTYLNEEVPEDSLKRIFGAAAIRHETRTQIFAWLRNLEEEDLQQGIVTITAAIENVLKSPLTPDVKEKLTTTAPEIQEITDAFRALAQQIVETRIANPNNIKVKNLLRVVRPNQTALVKGLLKRFEAEIAELKAA